MKTKPISLLLAFSVFLAACWAEPNLPLRLPTTAPSATPLLVQATHTLVMVTPTATVEVPTVEAPTETATIIVEAPTETPAPSSLTAQQVANMEYQLPTNLVDGALVSAMLSDGAYQSGSDTSAAGYMSVTLLKDLIALGDLNADGLADGAAILGINYGGSGTFVYLVVVLNQNGQPIHAPQALFGLGDRSRVEKLVVENGKIHLDMLRVGPNDAFCCASEPVSLTLDYTPAALMLRRLAMKTPGGQVREVRIESPADGALANGSVEIKGSFTIAPFENNITYRVYGPDNALLLEAGSMVNAPDLGAPGTFIIPLDVAALGVKGRIRVEVFESSAADGSTVMLDSIFLEVQ